MCYCILAIILLCSSGMGYLLFSVLNLYFMEFNGAHVNRYTTNIISVVLMIIIM